MNPSPTVLITGGAARLGRALSLALAEAGWDVAVHYNASEKDAHALAETLKVMGRKAHCVRADLSDPKAVARIVPELARQGVALDCLINNAAAFEKDTLADFSAASFHAHMDANLLAPMLLMRDFAAQYEGASGNIINITDGMESWSMSGAFLSYALSKQGLASATRLLARELAPRIRVNAVAPGATLPGKQDREDTFAKLAERIPLRRTSSPDELCGAVRYILSSPSLTGQTLSLSGGLSLVHI